MVTRLGGVHDEQQIVADQLRLGEPQSSQPLGPSPFHELEIVDVIDDAAGIRVLVIDPETLLERLSPCCARIL